MRDAIARTGIVASILALFALALLSVILEGHYVNTGANQISVDAKRGGHK
jgi:hypothetical protein